MSLRYFSFILIVLAIDPISAIPIDNGVEGDPEIECSANSITVNFNTRNDFQGHVYVKGRFGEPGCKSDDVGRRVAGIKLGFDACGTQRSRSLNPKGVFVTNTVVITFHPQFLTKVDRAYTIQCFYMESDKTVSQDLEVSDITTAFQTQTVPMPVCQYDILEGGPEGQPVKFASIGQQVYHKWSCTTETTDIFCAVVHSCFVDDGAGNHQQLLDENGCAVDKFLLQNLEYPSDLMAGHEAHVFKYADKPALFFQCQVTISIKEPGQQCARPQCGEAPGFNSRPNSGAASLPAALPGTAPPAPPPRASSPRPANPPGATPNAPASQPQRQVAVAAPIAPGARFLAPLQSILSGSPRPLAALIQRPTPSTNGTAPLATRQPSPPVSQSQALTSPPASPDNSIAPSQPQPAAAFDFPDRRRRAKRAPVAVSTESVAGTWDLRAQPITALDIDDDIRDDALNRRLSKNHFGSSQAQAQSQRKQSESEFCLSPLAFGLFLAFVISFSLFTVMIGIFYCLRKSSSK